ncbi:MAG: CDP-alcohol phosphatidyltransferase family protein [Bacilli bacterium]
MGATIMNNIKEKLSSVTNKINSVLDPIINSIPFEKRKNIPNNLTILRIVISVCMCGIILTYGIVNPVLMTLLAGVTALTDLADGHMARRYNLTSKKGAFLDALADKFFNYGLLVAFIGGGIMPLTLPVAGLLIPILARDLLVAGITAVDKYKDGKLIKDRESKNKEEFNKKRDLKTIIDDQIDTFEKGKNMPPTIMGKLKMWTMSLGVIGGLAFGFNPSGLGLTYYIGILLSQIICVGDVALVTKNTLSNIKKRDADYKLLHASLLEDKLVGPELKMSEVAFQKTVSPKKHTVLEEQYVEAEIERLEKNNYSTNKDIKTFYKK